MKNQIFDYNFKDIALLKAALTHPSKRGEKNYEKLEFLGDRILSAIIAEYLFLNYGENESEGDLAKRQADFVGGKNIAQIARENNLGKYMILGEGERKIGGEEKESNLENCLEAVIGAIFLDGGGAKAKEVVLKLWQESFKQQKSPPQNSKSKLQEVLQEKGLNLPEYQMLSQDGPDHSPIFNMSLKVKGYPDVQVTEKSKKQAEKKLASLMLKNMGYDNV